MAIEKYPLKMVIFHRYVSLPEGLCSYCPSLSSDYRLPGWPAASPGSLSRSARRPSAARTVAPTATPPGPWELGDVEWYVNGLVFFGSSHQISINIGLSCNFSHQSIGYGDVYIKFLGRWSWNCWGNGTSTNWEKHRRQKGPRNTQREMWINVG